MNTPAMIIDFEATDVSKEAEATQLGYYHVKFIDGVISTDDYYHYGETNISSPTVDCRPDRVISYGAMAVSHITPEDVDGYPSHKEVVLQHLPEGEAYIIGHNVDFDIQVAANAGVDVSQYKAICTQALARELIPCLDSHSLGACLYYIDQKAAKRYCRHAHNAGWDVTFTLWLLDYLCKVGSITNVQDLHNASEQARIPKIMPIGNDHRGKLIADMAKDPKDRGFLQWVVRTIKDKPYLVEACRQALITSINPNVSGMER